MRRAFASSLRATHALLLHAQRAALQANALFSADADPTTATTALAGEAEQLRQRLAELERMGSGGALDDSLRTLRAAATPISISSSATGRRWVTTAPPAFTLSTAAVFGVTG